jgi:hypothetical protein
MSDKDVKREEERKKRQEEFDRLMARTSVNRPPADRALLRRIAEVPLGPSTAPGPTPTAAPPSEPLLPTVATPLPPEETALKEPMAAPGTVGPAPEVTAPRGRDPEPSSPAAAVPVRQTESERSSLRARSLYATGDSKVELLLDEIASQVRARRKVNGTPGRRVSATVSEDSFNRVSHAAFARRLDKVEVLTYLLDRYVPKGRPTEIPSWLSQSEVEIEGRSRHLPFSKDDDLHDRLHWLQYRFSLVQVDIIENIIQKHLPTAPFSIKPKVRRRTVAKRNSNRG